MKDCMRLPDDVLAAFMRGEWTVSATGNPYHNQGMDEAHESLINKSTKDLTTRPTIYRIVELANFMAVLRKIFKGLTSYMFQYDSEKKSYDKQTTTLYAKSVYKLITESEVFAQNGRKLSNVFTSCAPDLDAEQREHLLKVKETGKSRMATYIRQYILEPPSEIRQKRKRNKLKTFSKAKSNIQSQKSQVSRLSKMTKSLTSRLQQTGLFYDRVLEYPLAICDEFGKMRPRHKSSFKDAILNISQMKSMFTTSVPFDMTGSEVIIDGLKFIHCPPMPTCTSYHQFALDLFAKMVLHHGFSKEQTVLL